MMWQFLANGGRCGPAAPEELEIQGSLTKPVLIGSLQTGVAKGKPAETR